MICTLAVLRDALQRYRGYRPTASLHLTAVRERWVPVHVATEDEPRAVGYANAVLVGNADLVVDSYRGLPQELRIAVVLCLVQGWADELRRLQAGGAREERVLTERTFSFLSKLSVDHVALAVRNDSFDIPLVQDLRLTKVEPFMKVFLRVRDHWQKVGFDWERRRRDEAALEVLQS